MIDDMTKIDSDMESVKDTISDADPVEYRDNMAESVQQGLAYEIYKNEDRVGFVYNRVEYGEYMGASIYITDTLAMLIALKTMFEIYDYHKITFVPHEDNLKYFKAMAYGPDIRVYHETGNHLVIRREDLETKGLRLFKYFGIEAL